MRDASLTVLDLEQLAVLLQAVGKGDRAALEKLYQLTSDRLFPVAMRIMRRHDLAEDVLQDAYLTVWRRAAQYKVEGGQPLAWMSAITRNHAIDRLRRDRRHNAVSLDNDDGATELASALAVPEAGNDHTSHALRQCVETLRPDYRQSLQLAYYYGLTHEELAAHLGSPVGTVKSWIRRALVQLKNCLEA